MRAIVLASTSPYRRELLGRLGLPFTAETPRFAETIDQEQSPAELVQQLALGKARSLAEAYPDALIIGSDQVFVVGGTIVGKPHTPERTFAQLRSMAGAAHTFYTGLAVIDTTTHGVLTCCVPSTVTLRKLSNQEIWNYIRKEQPFHCAGSFMIEGLGIALMERVEGDDFTALIGLPLIRLVTMLRTFGINPLGG